MGSFGKNEMSQQRERGRRERCACVLEKVCVCVQERGVEEVESKVPLRSLSIPPQMMDSNSGENKTKHSSCCHHNETGT